MCMIFFLLRFPRTQVESMLLWSGLHGRPSTLLKTILPLEHYHCLHVRVYTGTYRGVIIQFCTASTAPNMPDNYAETLPLITHG